MLTPKDIQQPSRDIQKLIIYQFGEFRVDIAAETLCRNDEKVSINWRRFQVLRLLVERGGEIVTKQDFFDKVWSETFVEENSLTRPR